MRLLRRATSMLRLAAFVPALVLGTACHNVDFSPLYGPDEIGIFDDLFSVAVVDKDVSVAVGYHGAAYYTTDGGETWKKGQTPTNRLLYSVSMADEQVGWAVGQLGTILRTEDGGRTWVEQPNLKKDESSHLFGVQALDRSRAIAVGAWGSRIFTEDGGKTWHDNSLTVGIEHPQFVWLTIEDQEKVREGGKVYEDVTLQDVFCLDDTHCWLIGEFGYIFLSEDAGRTWERGEILGGVQADPIVLDFDQIALDEKDKAQLNAFAEQIVDETHLNVLIDPFVSQRELDTYFSEEDPEPLFELIAARLDETRGVLEEAGLAIDRLRMYSKPPWDYEDFVKHDETFLDRYIDGRRAEEPKIEISIIQNPFLFTVRFADEDTGMISGLGGVVLRTEDGGHNWSYVATDRVQALFAVASTPGRAIAVGEKGLVQYSQDGGHTWKIPSERQFPTIFTFMRDINFAPDAPRTGYIVGQRGMVLRTEDGGDSWTQVLPPEERRRLGTGSMGG